MNALRLIALVLALAGCSAHRVNPEQAKTLVEGGARLVDVRSPEEFAAGHLPGAINIPVAELGARYHELAPKDQTLVIYCASGFRSGRAAKALAEWGFIDVVDLGSMDHWPKN